MVSNSACIKARPTKSSSLLFLWQPLSCKCISLPSRQKVLCVDPSEDFDQLANQAGPAGLVARTQSCPVITVELLVEQ